jgi:hypothetical protein
MYEGFSGQARKAIQTAHRESVRLGYDYLGTEHLLLGILREGTSGLNKLLAAFGTDPGTAYRHVEAGLPRGTGPASWDKLPLTPRARQMLERAREAASELNHSCVGVEHLFVAIVEEQDSNAAQLMLQLGITPQILRKELACLPDPENRDWLVRSQPVAGEQRLSDPSAGDLESVVSPAPLPDLGTAVETGQPADSLDSAISAVPLPPTDAPPSDGGMTGAREGKIAVPDIQWTSVVERQLEALQVLVCALGGALIGAAGLGVLAALLMAFIGSLVGMVLIVVKSNLLARAVGLAAGATWGLLYGAENPVVAKSAIALPFLVLMGGGFGLLFGFCLGDWRKSMSPSPEPPIPPVDKPVDTFSEQTGV